jgi:pimeloyl-ACP methyl ester carboxylesterase
MTASTLVFVHSPFVGPSSWAGVSRLFNESGSNAIAPALAFEAASDGSYYRALAHCVVRAADRAESAVLVVHSGAGSLSGAIADALNGRVAAIVFVDALLPHPQRSWMSTLSEGMRSNLRTRARDGRLPPWDRWFSPGVLERLIVDEEARAAFVAALPRVALAFADEIAPMRRGIEPCGYLRLSEGYDAEAHEAATLGWPVEYEALHHLAMITHPDRVATALRQLLDRMGAAV